MAAEWREAAGRAGKTGTVCRLPGSSPCHAEHRCRGGEGARSEWGARPGFSGARSLWWNLLRTLSSQLAMDSLVQETNLEKTKQIKSTPSKCLKSLSPNIDRDNGPSDPLQSDNITAIASGVMPEEEEPQAEEQGALSYLETKEWAKILASYSTSPPNALQAETVGTGNRSHMEGAKSNRKEVNSVGTREALPAGSVWPALLQTMQRSVDALQSQS